MNYEEQLQRYEDGDLTGSEKAQFEQELAQNPALAQELASFRMFKAALVDSRRADDVPLSALEAMVPKTAKQPWWMVPTLRRFAVVSGLMLLMGGGYLGFNYDPMRLDNSPALAIVQNPTPAYAAKWVLTTARMKTPVLDLGELGKMKAARCGSEWACYDYQVEGSEYKLYMSPETNRIERMSPSCTMNDIPVVEGRGMGWTHCGMAFYLKGGTPEGRKKIANELCGCICRQEAKNRGQE